MSFDLNELLFAFCCQGGTADLGGVLRVCEKHAEYWDGLLPSEIRLPAFFERALRAQDEVFQFWVAENGQGSVVGWEMLSAFSGDPSSRRLTGEATTCLGRPSTSLGRTLATHAVRHAVRTPLQYLFARVSTRDSLMNRSSSYTSSMADHDAEVASPDDSDKVSAPGDGMATKQATKKRATKAPAKKRTSKAPAKKRSSKAPAKKRASKSSAKKRTSKAPAKRRASKAPAKANRPTTPARPRAKKAASAAAPESVPTPVSPVVSQPPASAPPSPRAASYLESVPQDRTELVAGLFQVARGAAKDLRTLFTQALAMSHKKTDHYDR